MLLLGHVYTEQNYLKISYAVIYNFVKIMAASVSSKKNIRSYLTLLRSRKKVELLSILELNQVQAKLIS